MLCVAAVEEGVGAWGMMVGVMGQQTRGTDRLERLRRYRNRPQPDLSLGFLTKQFERQVARPHKQLEKVIELWEQLVPAELAEHTRLEGLQRGVLKVSVDSSSRLYALDGLLRGGLQKQLTVSYTGGTLRRVQLRVAI